MSKVFYRLSKKLFEGESNSTFRGEALLSNQDSRDVLIKLLHPKLTLDPVIASHLAGFLDVSRRIPESKIAPLWDFGKSGDYYFIVREYIPGIPLQHVFQLQKMGYTDISVPVGLMIAKTVADTLTHIHEYHVSDDNPIFLFHGGLCPENVILHGRHGIVVTDPGLDVIFWRHASISRELVKRKFPYQFTDSLEHKRPTRKSDIYSVMSLLFKLLTGENCHAGREENACFPSRLRADLRDLDPLFHRFVNGAHSKGRSLHMRDLSEALQETSFLANSQATFDFIRGLSVTLMPEMNWLEKEAGPLLFDYPFEIESLLPLSQMCFPPDSYSLPKNSLPNKSFKPMAPKDLPSEDDATIIANESELAARSYSDIAKKVSQDKAFFTSGVEKELTSSDILEDSFDKEHEPLLESDILDTGQYRLPLKAIVRDESKPVHSSLSDPFVAQAFDSSHSISPAETDGSTVIDSLCSGSFSHLSEVSVLSEHHDSGPSSPSLQSMERASSGYSSALSGDSFNKRPVTQRSDRDLGKYDSSQEIHSTRSLQSSSLPSFPETVNLSLQQVESLDERSSPPLPTVDPSIAMSKPIEQFGKFDLLHRIAVGGMAEVFCSRLRESNAPHQLFALKRILPNFAEDSNFVQMFRDEARNTSFLKHPHIVQTFELGEVRGSHYILMDFVDGIDLARVIKIQRALKGGIPLSVILSVGIAVCDALQYAHDARDQFGQSLKMIHRDVTPHNVLLSKNGEIKLTDFGIAKAVHNDTKTGVGELKGKLSYMSPEQVSGLPLDKRTDIFQVGILLYEQLTLKKMFEGASEHVIFSKIQKGEFARLKELAPGISNELDEAIMKSLHIDPAKRYQRAADFSRILSKHLEKENRSHVHFSIAPFVMEVIEQRQQLMRQYEEANKPVKHLQMQPTGLVSPVSTSSKKKQTITKPPEKIKLDHLSLPDRSIPSTKKKSRNGWKVFVSFLFFLLLTGVGCLLFLYGNGEQKTTFLSINTKPKGANVLVDGRSLGKTPLFEMNLPYIEQSQILEVKMKGFQSIRRNIEFKRVGQVLNIFMLLKPVGSHKDSK